IPRSPRWLVKKRRYEEAGHVLQMIGEENYKQELQHIIESIDAEHAANEPLFSRKYRFPIFLAVSIGMFNQLSGINAILYYVNDRIGRKMLLLVGSVGTAICLAGVAVIFFTARHESFLLWLLIGYIAFFAFSQGAVIWVYISEVFPNEVRAKGQSLGSFSHWFANAIVSWRYPLMAASSGGWPFAFFSIMMALQFFVVLVVYPETRGVTLEEMQRRLKIA